MIKRSLLLAVGLLIGGHVSLLGQVATNTPFLTNGLVAFYPLSGTANDATGNSNNAVIRNTTFTSDRFTSPTKALSLNGSTSEMAVSAALLNLGRDYTISLWFKLQDPKLQYQCLVYTPNRTVGVGIAYNDPTVPNAINWSVGSGTGPGWAASYQHGDKTDYVAGRWYQLVFLKSAHDYKLFIDGKVESAVTVPGDFDKNTGLDFGFLTSSPSYLNGGLDDVRIYNRALTDQEVKDLYRFESPLRPGLTVEVQTVRVTMYVRPTRNYQLQSSFELKAWTNVGNSFVASTSEIPLTLDATTIGRYFRLFEIQ